MIDFATWKTLNDAILDGARALDDGDHARFLAWFAPDGCYRLTAHVPELGTDNAWLDLDRAGLERLLQSAQRHVWPTGQRLHTIGSPHMQQDDSDILVTSSVLVHRTQHDGLTTLFAAGRYHDRWTRVNDQWLLRERDCRLDTRNLAPPSAIPL